MRSILGSLAAFAVCAMAGCGVGLEGGIRGTPGSGVAAESTRETAGFDAVDVGSALKLVVTPGAAVSVKVSGDDNLVPLVVTEVKGTTLTARMKSGSYSPKLPLTVTVVTPKLASVRAVEASTGDVAAGQGERFVAEASGASTVRLKGLDVKELELKAEGASTLSAMGKAEHVRVRASGASTIMAATLDAQAVEATVKEASRAEVRALSSITGESESAASLRVQGAPATRDVKTSSAGSVNYEP